MEIVQTPSLSCSNYFGSCADSHSPINLTARRKRQGYDPNEINRMKGITFPTILLLLFLSHPFYPLHLCECIKSI